MDDETHSNPMLLRDSLVERMESVERQLKELHNEREALRHDLTITEQFINVWLRARNTQVSNDIASYTPYPITSDVPLPPQRPKNPAREKVVDAALEIISERGEPVSRGHLLEALHARGIELFGKNPAMVLSTMLWRSQDRIIRLGSKGYWFKDRDYDPAGYYADLDDPLDVSDPNPEDGQIEDPDDETEVTSSRA